MAAGVNPIQLQKYLKGVHYPADKKTLVERARDQGADREAMAALEDLPEQEYDRPSDVSKALKKAA